MEYVRQMRESHHQFKCDTAGIIVNPLFPHLAKYNQWVWGDPQRQSFKVIKKALTQSPITMRYQCQQTPFNAVLELSSVRNSQMESSNLHVALLIRNKTITQF